MSKNKDEFSRLKRLLTKYSLTPDQATDMLKKMQHQKARDYSVFKHDFNGKRVRIGVCGDNHFGNKWTDKQFLNDIYREFDRMRVEAVYHTGDITDGPYQAHRGAVHEQYAHGLQDQVTDVVKDYPRLKRGKKTFFITGNHDNWYKKNIGQGPGELIAAEREDLIFLGEDEATIKIQKVSMMMSHPDDGGSYAYSYKAQKLLESMFKMGESMPDIILQGHYHKIIQMLFGGVHYFCTGTTEHQTPWMRNKKLAADLGAWILDLELNNKGELTSLTSKLLPFKGKRKRLDG